MFYLLVYMHLSTDDLY